MNLTREVQNLQVTPVPGSYRPEDLSAASREQLQPLLDRGVPMERAVQMLLLQERYQQTLKKLQNSAGGGASATPPTPPPR
jgi:type II secretory pathway component PulF